MSESVDDTLKRLAPKVRENVAALDRLAVAHARRTDPATSHAAAADVSLRVNNIELQVLAALVLRGPSTSHDIAAYTELSLVTISPRMAPLEARGLVVRAGVADRRTLWEVTPRAMLVVA